MENKQNLRLRITILYIVYFAALLGGIIYNTGPAFKRGAKLGLETSTSLTSSWLDGGSMRSSIIYIGVPTDNITVNATQLDDERNTSVTLMAPKFDVVISQDADQNASLWDMTFVSVGGSIWVYLASLAMLGLYIVVFILIFFIIHSLRNSIRNDAPLAKKCVWYIRIIGLIIIVVDFIDAWAQWTMSCGAAPYLEAAGFAVDTSFTLNYYTLLLACLVIFSAEIFSIGSKLGEEQKLTI